MLEQVTISNFKCLREVQVDLERFTVFVGPNASGKSSILQALDILSRAFHAEDSQVEAELIRAMSRGSRLPVELLTKAGETKYRYRTRDTVAPIQPDFHVSQRTWTGSGKAFLTDLTTDAWEPWNPNVLSVGPLPPSVLLRLEASNLVQPHQGPDPTVMTPEGVGLHTALASMALNDPDSWQQLQADLRRIIPTIRRLRHTASRPSQPSSLLFDTVGADSLPATQVSEGTLLVLGLLAALHGPNRPSLVLLDDLDRGLDPKAQKELIALLRGLLDTNPDLQIVATTHSPYMLDWMGVDEVRMTFLKDDGATVCAALTEHPKYPNWKDEMTPGEMWSLFGEKWVAEGVTA